nr:G-protein coupled receptor family C group 5 member B-like [Paramormyrops kingsleyae]
MAFPSVFHILLNFSLAGSSFAEDEASPGGCGSLLKRPFTAVYDLDAVWGVAVAGMAVLASLILALVLLCRLQRITEAEARSGVAPLLLLLATIIMLCAVSFMHVIESEEHVCIARHALWGVLYVLSIAYLTSHGVRLFRRSCFRALAVLAMGLAVMQGIAIIEWILAIVLHPGQPVCQYNPLQIALICIYGLALLIVVPMTLACVLSIAIVEWILAIALHSDQLVCQHQPLCISLVCLYGLALFIAVLMTLTCGLARGQPLWIYRISPSWEDQMLEKVLVMQAWLLLVLHATPEAHACLRRALQPSGPDDVVPSQAQPHPREASLEESIPLPTRSIVETQGSAFHSSSDFSYNSEPCQIQRYAVDTAIIGCIRGDQEEEYRGLVRDFVVWCRLNHLQLNTSKTKELVIDYRKSKPCPQPVQIEGGDTEVV